VGVFFLSKIKGLYCVVRKMSARPGSSEARDFFNSTTATAAEWCTVLGNHAKAVALVGEKKKKLDELRGLDSFRSDLADVVRKRSPPQLTRAELSRVMAWKLLRGKFRPLQKLVDSNSESDVKASSTESFRLATDPSKWKESINAMAGLKGVGVATASAVLAAIFPNIFPFMADETIEAVVASGQRDYNLKVYTEMRQLLVDRAAKLNSEGSSHQWSVADVGEAVWVFAIMSSFGQSPTVATGKSASSSRAIASPIEASFAKASAAAAGGGSASAGGKTKRTADGESKASSEQVKEVHEPASSPKRRKK
jgi:hypothetical protein